jgi:hypothetical protein
VPSHADRRTLAGGARVEQTTSLAGAARLKEVIAVRLHLLLGLACSFGSLMACAKGGGFLGTGGSSTEGGGSGGTAGSGGTMTSTTTTSAAGGGMTSTTTTTSTGMEVCEETPCKLVEPQCGCAADEMCAVINTGAIECHSPVGDVSIGQVCTGLYSCEPGSLCTLKSSSTSTCTRYCDADAQCGGGLCLIQLNDPQNPGQVLPGVTLCSDDCNPVTNVGCPAGLGLGCQLGQQQDGAMTVFSVCNGAGNGGQYATCADQEDCAPGFACFDTGVLECLQYCNPPNGICSGGATCVSFNPQLFYKGVEYGACL